MKIKCDFTQPALQMVCKDLAQFVQPWKCTWYRDGKERNLCVPIGYCIDGMSVPRFAWSFGAGNAASGSHDPLYRAMGGLKPDAWKGCTLTDAKGNDVLVSRNEADRLMQVILLGSGFNWLQCATAYRVVTTFGGSHWGGPIPSR